MHKYTAWHQIPDGLKTKTQWRAEGRKLAPDAQPNAKVLHRARSRYIPLYGVEATVAKRPCSEAQLAALERARVAALKTWDCRQCGFRLKPSKRGKGGSGLCAECRHEQWLETVKAEIVVQAQAWVGREDVLILDTETTGLNNPEIIELAIINMRGEVLLNQRFKPVTRIEAGAEAVHGIRAAMLADEPSFVEMWSRIAAIFEAAGGYMSYNLAFDKQALEYTLEVGLRQHGLTLDDYPLFQHPDYEFPCFNPDYRMEEACLMEMWARFRKSWSSRHQDFRWLPLHGDHSALGDAQEALGRLRTMAGIDKK